MIKQEHREYLRETMGLNNHTCPICGKEQKTMILRDRKWICQECDVGMEKPENDPEIT